MSSSIKNRLLLFATAVALPLNLALAQPPSGLVSFSFDRQTAPVYDLTGPYQVDQQAQGAGGSLLDVSYGMNLSQDAHGRLAASDLTFLQIGNDVVAADSRVSGKIYGGGAKTRASLSVRFTGEDNIGGLVRRFTVSISYALTVDPESLALVGTARGKVQVTGIGSSNIRTNVSIPLPPQVDGAWSVLMNIVPLQQLGGSGTFVIDNFTPPDNNVGEPTDRILNAKLTGSYSARQQLSKVKLTGYNESRGNTVDLSFATGLNGSQNVVGLKGTLLGQTVRQ